MTDVRIEGAGPAELARVARFAVVGATNTAVTLASYGVLVACGLVAPAAAAIGFAAGALNGYRLNRRWTFRVAPGGAPMVARYALVQLAGAGLSALGVAVAAGAGVARLPAEVVTIPAVTLITYGLTRQAVFRPMR